MWKIKYSEFFIKKNDVIPYKVDIKLIRGKCNVKFTLSYKKFELFIKKKIMYYNNGIYDIIIDYNKDIVSIMINKDHKIGYLIYNFNEGKELYDKLKNIFNNKSKLKCSKKLYY